MRVNGTISRVSATITDEFQLGSYWVDEIKYRGEYAALVQSTYDDDKGRIDIFRIDENL